MWSVYCDTAGLWFYWEKVEGLRGVDVAAVDRDAGQLRTLIQQRTESLHDGEVITGGGGG